QGAGSCGGLAMPSSSVPDRRRTKLLAMAGFIAIVALVAACSGGAAPQILSNVGNSVGGGNAGVPSSGQAAATAAPAGQYGDGSTGSAPGGRPNPPNE